MSTGAEKVLPLGSADRLAGELAPEQSSVWFCLTVFPLLTCLDQQWRLELGIEGDDLEAKGQRFGKKDTFLSPVRESFLHLFSLARSDGNDQPLPT